MASVPQAASSTQRIQRFPIAPAGSDRAIAQTVAKMKQLVLGPEGVYNAQVRAAAVEAARGAPAKNDAAERSAVFQWVKQKIDFRGEYAETLQSPLVTLQLRAGDCDDHSTLLAALLGSLGHKVRFNTIATSRTDKEFSHVFVEDLDRQTGQWVPLDTTVKNSYVGWYPPRITRSRTWGTLGRLGQNELVPIPVAPAGLGPKGQFAYNIAAPFAQAFASQIAHGTTPMATGNLNFGLSTSSLNQGGGIPGWVLLVGGAAVVFLVLNLKRQ